MTYYSPFEQRERYAFIESSVENYLNVLQKNDAENGYIHPDTVHEHREIIDKLVIPNIRNGALSLGSSALRYRDDSIPVWSASWSEITRLSSTLVAPTLQQKTTIYNSLTQLEVQKSDIDRVFYHLRNEREASLEKCGAIACVLYNRAWGRTDQNKILHIKGRPIMLFSMEFPADDENVRLERASPGTVHHEIVHVKQSLTNPFYHTKEKDEDDRYNLLVAAELEAYLHHADMEDELRRQDYVPKTETVTEDLEMFEDLQDIAEAYGDIEKPNYTLRHTSRAVKITKELGLASTIAPR